MIKSLYASNRFRSFSICSSRHWAVPWWTIFTRLWQDLSTDAQSSSPFLVSSWSSWAQTNIVYVTTAMIITAQCNHSVLHGFMIFTFFPPHLEKVHVSLCLFKWEQRRMLQRTVHPSGVQWSISQHSLEIVPLPQSLLQCWSQILHLQVTTRRYRMMSGDAAGQTWEDGLSVSFVLKNYRNVLLLYFHHCEKYFPSCNFG